MSKQQTTETNNYKPLININTMTIEELGIEYGKTAAEAFNFLYDKLGNSPTISDELKQNVKAEREKTFATLIPMIKHFRTLSEEDKQTFRLNSGSTMAQNIPDLLSHSEKLQTALGNAAAVGDENFMLDVVSLYMVQNFLEDGAFSGEGAPNLPKHVGLE